jgi:hypothetical protein
MVSGINNNHHQPLRVVSQRAVAIRAVITTVATITAGI